MVDTTLAYLAGAMDSDGCLTIRRCTYNIRVTRSSSNPTFSERLLFKQVTPEIPHILQSLFGGRLAQEKPSCKKNGRPLWNWQCTDKKAAEATRKLFPFLLVKRKQAELILELRETKNSRYSQMSYWFEKENPDWHNMPMITTDEVTRIMNYANNSITLQAVSNGTILALPGKRGSTVPRFPLPFIMMYAERFSANGVGRSRPKQLIEWRERLFNSIRELNKIGINGTSIYHQTGCHKPTEV